MWIEENYLSAELLPYVNVLKYQNTNELLNYKYYNITQSTKSKKRIFCNF